MFESKRSAPPAFEELLRRTAALQAGGDLVSVRVDVDDEGECRLAVPIVAKVRDFEAGSGARVVARPNHGEPSPSDRFSKRVGRATGALGGAVGAVAEINPRVGVAPE